MSNAGMETFDLTLPKHIKRIGVSCPNGGKTLSIAVGQIVKFAPKGVENAQVFLQVWVMSIEELDQNRHSVKFAYQGDYAHMVETSAPLRIMFTPARKRTTH
jgi:hypothetical protein